MKPTTFLSDTFFAVASLILFLGVVALVFPALVLAVVAAWPILFLLLLLDRFSLPRGQEIRATFTLPRVMELGEKAEVEIAVRQPRFVRAREIWLLPPVARCLEFPAQLISVPRRRSGEYTHQRRLRLPTVHLGYETIPQVILVVPSKLRFWRRRFLLPIAGAQYRVIPSLRRIEEQNYREVRSQSRLLYQGSRRLLRSQSPDQFHSLRKYQFPDPIRHIDPKKTAKFGQLMTRNFDTYFDHHVVIGLDVGRAMEGEIADQPKLDYYLSSILSIAENAVQSRDRISLFSFSQKIHYLIKSTRQIGHFQPVFEGRPPFRSREEESHYELLQAGLQWVAPQRALFVLFTDISKPSVQEALALNLPRIAAKHLCIVLSVSDESHNVVSTVKTLHQKGVTVESYSDLLYRSFLEDRLRSFRLAASTHGAGVVLVPHTHWLSAVNRLYTELRKSSRL